MPTLHQALPIVQPAQAHRLSRVTRLVAGERRRIVAVALLHAAIAFILFLRGLNFNPGGRLLDIWGHFWHGLPLESFHDDFWRTLWVEHAQPPGFSLLVWVCLRLFGQARFLTAMQAIYIALGTATVAMTHEMGVGLTRSRRWGLAIGLAMALNPTLLAYEAYVLYDAPVVFLVVASAWCLWRALAGGRRRWLMAMIVCLNALVLTRSMFHLVFLVGALALAWPLWRGLGWRRGLTLALLAVAAPAAWYGKNLAQHGFFGASSWYGLGWFRCVVRGYNSRELLELSRRGVIPEMVARLWPYQHTPIQYAPFGFQRRSDNPVFMEDNWHNINVPAISVVYARACRTLILRDPGRYLRTMERCYRRFCRPPAEFGHLWPQIQGYVRWEPPVANFLYGVWLTDAIEPFAGVDFGSLFYLYFPLLLVGSAAWGWRRWRRDRPSFTAGAAQPGAPSAWARPLLIAYFLYVCLYVVAAACMFEYGENMRFRLPSEPFTLIMIFLLLRSFWNRLPRKLKDEG